jgi:thioesterase domain-containing protein/acyl carrier protein
LERCLHADDGLQKKMKLLQEIKALGAEITLLSVDVTNSYQVKEALDKIKNEIGTINGVVHAAGLPGGGLAQLKMVEMANKVFLPKIQGTYILSHFLQNEALDFFIMCSSISSVTSELSQVDYCAANACLDAFSYANIFKNVSLVTSINWNTWREIGVAVEIERPKDIDFFDRKNDISPEEGAKIFIDILNNHYRQAIVSTFDLQLFNQLFKKNKDEVISVENLAERYDVLDEDTNYLPPQNPIEKELVIIWQNLFGINKIGILDDFYSLGGHSLTSLRLLAKIEQKFNVKISLEDLQKVKTIQQLAMMLQMKSGDKQSTSSCIVPIRLTGRESPFFCFHPVSGNAFCYLNLAENLIFDCPIYGIQDPSIEQEKLIFSSLEEMTTFYIREIKKIQPRGPYLLGGLSFGATLAVEAAKQLKYQGEQIKPLIFFDGWAKFSNEQCKKNIFINTIKRLCKDKVKDLLLIDTCWDRMCLLLKYQPPRIKEKIVLFKAQDLLPEYKIFNQKYNYWDLYADNDIELYIVPGNHETILEVPNVVILADKLSKTLSQFANMEIV